jgi:hypothetical protein
MLLNNCMGRYYKTEAIIENVEGSNKGFAAADVVRDIGLRPFTGAGTVDDYFCYYNSWQGQDPGGEGDSGNFNVTAGGISFGTFRFVRSDEAVTGTADIVLVRKSDRAAIRITGNMEATPTFTLISNNASYPELQRLRLLGII